MNSNYLHSEITGLIIKAFYNVYNSLGFGFLEKVYENAMLIEMGKLGGY
jgi:GxxExxY protein